jgi:hypothetical protein
MFYLNGAHVRNYASHSIYDTVCQSELQYVNNKSCEIQRFMIWEVLLTINCLYIMHPIVCYNEYEQLDFSVKQTLSYINTATCFG